MNQRIGKWSLRFSEAPFIISEASIVGTKEGDGPLGGLFDLVGEDDKFGQNTWEEAESSMQADALSMALGKAKRRPEDIDYVFAGDLLGQSMATTFGLEKFKIPLFGVYGACSTCGETLSLAAAFTAAGYGDYIAAVTSSHFGSAEKQFRFPNQYANQRPICATWTVTGSGAFILSKNKKTGKDADKLNEESDKSYDVMIEGITTGTVVDYGIKESMNMGAAMAYSACETIKKHLIDTGRDEKYYDLILTGDLGIYGIKILKECYKKKYKNTLDNVIDSGSIFYNNKSVYAGASGPLCLPLILFDHILPLKKYNKILIVGTGSLHSVLSTNLNLNIPSISHAVSLEVSY